MRIITLILAIIPVCLLLGLSGCASAEKTPEAELSRIEDLPHYEPPMPPLRLHDEPQFDFIQSVDYGAVYPYIGQVVKANWGSDYPLYGFIDTEGRIICEPIYNVVSLMTYGEKSAYAVSRFVYPDGVNWSGENNGANGFWGVISADGSFYGKFDEVYIGGEYNTIPFNYEYIPVKTGGKWGAIDFDGEKLLSCVYPNAPLFSEGLAAVYNDAEDLKELVEYYDAKIPYRYIDTSGETVLGTYERPPMPGEYFMVDMSRYDLHLEAAVFQNGRAMNFEGWYYGFIDKAGSLVIPREFSLLQSEQFRWNEHGFIPVCIAEVEEKMTDWGYNQILYVSDGDNDLVKFALIDSSGQRDAEWMSSRRLNYNNGYYIARDVEWRVISVYDSMGNKVFGKSHDFSNGYVINQLDEATWRITGNGTNSDISTLALYYVYGGWFQCHQWDGDDIRYWMWNAQTGETNENTFGLFASDSKRDLSICLLYNDNITKYGVMNEAGEMLIDFKFDRLEWIGDKYLAVHGRYGGLLDARGEWIAKIPLVYNYD